MTTKTLALGSVVALLSLVTGCRKEYDLGVSDTAQYPADQDDTDSDASEDPDDYDWGDSEVEDDFLALTPAQTDQFVFIANPGRDTLTRVDVYTQDVRTVGVGRDPSIVLTIPGANEAVVFNRVGDSVSFVGADDLEVEEVDVRDDMNSMVLSPDNAFLVLWHDRAAQDPEDPAPDGLQSFNEVSFVEVATREHSPMAVGFNPKDVQFTPDGRLAVVVSDASVAVVDLEASVLSPNVVRVTDNLVDPPLVEEVVISPDGRWAFVRQFGVEHIVVVDLVDEEIVEIPVGANPTDVDLSPDGSLVAVMARHAEELWVFDASDPLGSEPDVLPLPADMYLGSLTFSPMGDMAILYTTAAYIDRYASWDLSTDEIELRSLVKPVRSVAITPTGDDMLVFHTRQDVPETDPESRFYNQWVMTMVDLRDRRTNPLLLPAEPLGYANSDSGELGYFIMRNQAWLEVLRYGPLLHDEIPLKSAPVYLGVMPDPAVDADEPPAWVSQEHTLGRISFYDTDDDTLETITGFELNSAIED